MQDDGGDGSDSSDEEKKRLFRGKRSRVNSVKCERLKEKLL